MCRQDQRFRDMYNVDSCDVVITGIFHQVCRQHCYQQRCIVCVALLSFETSARCYHQRSEQLAAAVQRPGRPEAASSPRAGCSLACMGSRRLTLPYPCPYPLPTVHSPTLNLTGARVADQLCGTGAVLRAGPRMAVWRPSTLPRGQRGGGTGGGMGIKAACGCHAQEQDEC